MFELSVKEGRDGDLSALIAEMVGATERNEPGTLDYEWYLSDDGRRVHIFERYIHSQAVMTHLAAFNERYMKRFFGILEPRRLVMYGAPDEAVRDAMSQLSPEVLQQAAGFSRRGLTASAATAAASAAAAAASGATSAAPPG
jgi:quinol monooxygenase YgiN